MKVINSFKKDWTKSVVNEMIATKSKVLTDGSNGYNDLKKDYNHHPEVFLKSESSKKFHGYTQRLVMLKNYY